MRDLRLFLDESGDHNLALVDPNFPVFCLTGIVVEKFYYHGTIRKEFDNLKQEFWGRTDVIFHSREIRKHEGDFAILSNKGIREKFYESLDQLITNLKFSIVAVVIFKNSHKEKYGDMAQHPYNLSLEFIMERFNTIINKGNGGSGFITAESRGTREDNILLEEYNRLQRYGNRYFPRGMPNITNLTMKKKTENIIGLQLADLVAYPIASKVLRPTKVNLSFNTLVSKIYSAPPDKGGKIIGYGLKIFPQPSKEHNELWG